MQTTTALSLIASAALVANGQSLSTTTQADVAATKNAYSIKEIGLNHRVWERTDYETNSAGEAIPRVHRYTELASGLYYFDTNAKGLRESSEVIEPVSGGAAALYGQSKAFFPSDIYDGNIELVTPEGTHLKSRPLCLSYFDGTNSAIIGTLTSVIGELVGSNQVVYTGAFTNVETGENLDANLIYTYRKGSFEQDILITRQLPAPEAYGLNSQNTRLQVITEFLDVPRPELRADSVPTAVGQLEDDQIAYGALRFGAGKAFLLGTNSPATPVNKRWLELDQRQMLLEEIPMPAIQDALSRLPSQASSATPRRFNRLAANQPPLPAFRAATVANKRPLQVAKGPLPKSGFLLDYTTLTGTIGNPDYTFYGDTTYLISGSVAISGIATFEGGSVIKYAPGTAININYPGVVKMLSSAYHPVVFTARDDNSVGQNTSAGPLTGYYANPAIAISGPGGTSLSLTNFRIAYANCAVSATSSGALVLLADGQIINCSTVFNSPGLIGLTVQNMLFAKFWNAFTGSYMNIQAKNVTFDGNRFNPPAQTTPSFLLQGSLSGVMMNAKNCIFANVTFFSFNSSILSGDHNGFYNNGTQHNLVFGDPLTQYTSPSDPFQVVKGGNYYLAGTAFRGVGAVTIPSSLQSDLRQKTTYPPVPHENLAVPVGTPLGQQATRDPGVTGFDLGYHYPILDHIFGNCTLNANLTIAAGTACGWYRTTSQGHGIQGTDVSVTFNGTQASPDYWVRLNTVQEGDVSGGGTSGGLFVSGTTMPVEVNARFTRFSMMASEDRHIGGDNGNTQFALKANHCEFWGSMLGGTYSPTALNLTNCLLHRCLVEKVGSSWGDVNLRNCTMQGRGLVLLQGSTDWRVSVRDCAFDGSSFSLSPVIIGLDPDWSYFDLDYNALSASAPGYHWGPNDLPNVNFNWQIGPLGNFYLPAGSPLIDHDHVTDTPSVGLSYFTTRTTASSKEGTSYLDIGYHYVALDSNGNAIDTESDGLPDWWADLYSLSVIDWNAGPDPLRGPNDDPDGDGLSNLQEYQLGSSPIEHNDLANPLALPPVGARYLRIISPSVLELTRIVAGGDAAWNFGATPPGANKFLITANGNPVSAQQVGFKRRPLYNSYPDTSDLRIENTLYLVLGSALNPNDTVQVQKANLWWYVDWPDYLRFVARNDPLRYGPAIHVNQEGYPVQVSQGGTPVPAPQTAIVGYYCGSLSAPPAPASITIGAYAADGGPIETYGNPWNCYGPVSLGNGFGAAFEVGSLDTTILHNLPPNDPSVFWVGTMLHVGAADMTVTRLGRWVFGGNSTYPRNTQTHTVKLVKVLPDTTQVVLGSVSIDTAAATPDQFAWALLPSPVILSANGDYYLLSRETSGGDYWYGYESQLRFGGMGQIDFSAVVNSSVKLVDATTGAVVPGCSPTVSPSTDSGGEASHQYQGLLRINLNGFPQSGTYRLQVGGLGASFPFRIGDDVPMKLARTYALGLYHQRCGSASAKYTGGTALPITRITGSGTGATITPAIVSGVVTGGTIVNGGSGWNVGDTFTFVDATGTGFAGTVATVTGGPPGALATFIVRQVNDLPFTRFTHGNCHAAEARVCVPDLADYYSTAWDIIAGRNNRDGYGNHPNPDQHAESLTSPDDTHMIFQFSKIRNDVNDNHQEVVNFDGTGRAIDVSGGHHDAGDYSKYTINSAQLIHTLVFAADNFPYAADLNNLGIPESGRSVPIDGQNVPVSDLLAEAKWEADFLVKMQDNGTARMRFTGTPILDGQGNPVPDGGFYTLVYPRNREYEGDVLPDHGDPQILWPKTTSVTAAAVGALAEIGSSRKFCSRFGYNYNDWQNNPYLAAALRGWAFLMRALAPGKDDCYQTLYNYGEVFCHNDELAWAAAAMFAAGHSDTPASGHDPHTLLKAWYPQPHIRNSSTPFSYTCVGVGPGHNNSPCLSWYYGWWGLYQSYGCAVRDYAFAMLSGRNPNGIDNTYLGYCQTAAKNWGHIMRSWSETNAYRTSASTASDGYGWRPEFYFPGYNAFDIVVADQLDTGTEDHSRNTAAVLGCLNFELGCNPNNVCFLAGLGPRRQRAVVNQYWSNAGRVLPPTGNPSGSINDFQSPADSVLKANFYPAAENQPNSFALYDRWSDAPGRTTEFVGVQTARSLATAAWLAAQSSANRNQQWSAADITSAQGTLTPAFTFLELNSRQIVQLTSPTLDLSQARVVWDVPGQQPAFGTSFTVTAGTTGERTVQAEAALPDGRRVFASRSFGVYDPNGGANFISDANTIALYHFDTDLTTDSANGYNLTIQAGGTPVLANNTTWMNNYPNSGHVARFSKKGDALVAAIPACVILPPDSCGTALHPLTIEARIYPRAYRDDGLGIVTLFQFYTVTPLPAASQWALSYDYRLSAEAPGIVANCCSTDPGCCPFVTGSQVKAALTLNTWHRLMITFDNSTHLTKAYIDGVLQGTSNQEPVYDHPPSDWYFTLGNFDGDIDEVRISNVLRNP